MKSLWEKLAYCAEVDVNLPGSLIADAWDRLEADRERFAGIAMDERITFERRLGWAVDAYLASPLTYEFNRRVG